MDRIEHWLLTRWTNELSNCGELIWEAPRFLDAARWLRIRGAVERKLSALATREIGTTLRPDADQAKLRKSNRIKMRGESEDRLTQAITDDCHDVALLVMESVASQRDRFMREGAAQAEADSKRAAIREQAAPVIEAGRGKREAKRRAYELARAQAEERRRAAVERVAQYLAAYVSVTEEERRAVEAAMAAVDPTSPA